MEKVVIINRPMYEDHTYRYCAWLVGLNNSERWCLTLKTISRYGILDPNRIWEAACAILYSSDRAVYIATPNQLNGRPLQRTTQLKRRLTWSVTFWYNADIVREFMRLMENGVRCCKSISDTICRMRSEDDRSQPLQLCLTHHPPINQRAYKMHKQKNVS